MAKTPLKEKITGGWIAMVQHYFVSAWIPAATTTNSFYTKHDEKNNLYFLGFTGPRVEIASGSEVDFENLMLALAETHHDDKGLTLPPTASAFDVYLMHVPGKTMDTKAKAEEIYNALQNAGTSVLFDDRDERAGVKFNDADLIGCPVRLTVGEKGLQNGMVELKRRTSSENGTLSVDSLLNSENIDLLIKK